MRKKHDLTIISYPDVSERIEVLNKYQYGMFDFAEERERVRGTMDGDLKHTREDLKDTEKEQSQVN
jgi:hypothetical protein